MGNSNNVQTIWQDCLAIIKDNIVPDQFETWFKPIVPVSFDGESIYLKLPSMYFKEFIEERFANLLCYTLERVTQAKVKIYYRVLVDKIHEKTADLESETKPMQPTTVQGAGTPFNYVLPQNFDSQLNPKYNFHTFIEGSTNRLARQVGITISTSEKAQTFNPMFIFGSPTVGKTHVAQAIGVATKQNFPNQRVLYLSANQFKTQFMSASAENRIADFINFYQSLDMLIIDDIQTIKHNEKTQLAFFNIFDHLIKMNKKLIVTCDSAPDKLDGMDERLLTRFQWGLRAEIEKPDAELRKAILMHHIHTDGLKVDEEVVDYIAENIQDNVRNLLGSFISIYTRSTIFNEPLTIELVQNFIGQPVVKPTKCITIDYIKDVVCKYYAVTKEQVVSGLRNREVAQARQIAMYLSRQHTKSSLNTIGRSFGNRDHATVKYSCRQVENMMSTDRTIKNDVEILSGQITE